ncbi:MAG: primosomal protein N' [Alphaproteobacteria bacterium]|nr:primosomal protein N' [Alphaproteobacteria bacterium]
MTQAARVNDSTTGSGSGERIAEVLVPVAVDMTYSYRIPAGIDLAAGDFVEVPLGTRETTGVVWEVRSSPAAANLKTVKAKFERPALAEPLRRFADWIANYTLAPRGMVLRMAARAPDHAGPERPRIGVRLPDIAHTPERLTPARKRVLQVAECGLVFSKSALAETAACSVSVVDGLIDEGALETIALPPEPAALPPDAGFAQTPFEPQQAQAAQILRDAVARNSFSVTLLDGVTGSGKTEVYFESVAQAIREGRQALILLPEIALTAQFLDRFAARFGVRPAEWHSGISQRKRYRIWHGVSDGEVKVVAGARSALFLPFQKLGLIVIDEEHENAYKQEDGVSYHARDMAVVRGRLENAAVILASATPSIETRVNAQQGRYAHVKLDARFGGRALPNIVPVDLKTNGAPRGKWISPPLARRMEETLARGEQVLLFLNRRGYAPLTLCASCGHKYQCPNCSTWLVEHRFRRALMCHHCGHVERRLEACIECGEAGTLTACGPGVERLADEVAECFPNARRIVLSSDFPGGTERLKRELEEIAAGAFDIVIGTQLVAKGHNFPGMTLVGVIDADIGLASGDPRAAERTFQLLQQVTGRAGRGDAPGVGYVQTWHRDHPVMRALVSGDAERFYEEEIEQRRRAGLPPFGRMAALIVSASDRTLAETHARALLRAAYALPDNERWRLTRASAMPDGESIVILGPAEAPILMVRGRYRYRLLVKAPRTMDMQGFLRAMLREAPKERASLRVQVDVDPVSFF